MILVEGGKKMDKQTHEEIDSIYDAIVDLHYKIDEIMKHLGMPIDELLESENGKGAEKLSEGETTYIQD